MATEQVLQNLHALQLVIGLHKGEASKYGVVEHAPALQMNAQCSATKVCRHEAELRNGKHLSVHIPVPIACQLKDLSQYRHKQYKRKQHTILSSMT